MKKILFSIMAGLLVLGGCSQSEEEKPAKKDEVPQIIEAVIEVPETINPGEEAALAVTVKQGGEAVTDAEVTMAMGDAGTDFFLEQINPGLSKSGKVVFEVPGDLDLTKAVLQCQTGFWGTETIEIKLK